MMIGKLLRRSLTTPLLCTILFTLTAAGQKDGKLQLDEDGIQVYSQISESSPFKTVRTVGIVHTSLSRIAYVLMDVHNTEDWVYGAKNSKLLNQISPSDLIYYAEAALPWPLSNRDFIIRITLTQDPVTKELTIVAKNMPDYVPEKKGLVRIQRSAGLWKLRPAGDNQVRVEYSLQVDPGGFLPPWLVNLFASNGPYQSLKNLRKEVLLPKYSQSRLPGIVD